MEQSSEDDDNESGEQKLFVDQLMGKYADFLKSILGGGVSSMGPCGGFVVPRDGRAMMRERQRRMRDGMRRRQEMHRKQQEEETVVVARNLERQCSN